jgi:glycosyltransferase involved in cell wall biosynthesis
MKKSKVVIVLPAYNAEKTLIKTYKDISDEYKKNVILVDDKSTDKTIEIAKKLKIKYFVHKKNLGYGGNQKTCYKEALKLNPDIIIMIHPDYQYDPKLIPALVGMIESGNYDCVLGSRILGGGALKGGMPLYKYVSNRFLTFFENICTGIKLSEYHTGLRAYRSEVLKKIDFTKNSDDFIFDNQILLQIIAKRFRIGEISCPTKYFEEASSINFIRSLKYGFGCVYWSIIYMLGRLNIYKHQLIFD